MTTETIHFTSLLEKCRDIVWGPAMLLLLLGTGVFLTIYTKALCLRNLPYALKSTFSKESRTTSKKGDVSPFSALTTALAATIGTGNIVGVATAMVAGGPGALVWMWISAAFGITSKFSECMLACKYRQVNKKGEITGGPMFTMQKAFPIPAIGAVLGCFFAFFTVLSSFGIGNLTQANSISTALNTTYHISPYLTGLIITILAFIIILRGIKTISKMSQIIVPFMALFYILSGLFVIILNISNLPSGIVMIFRMAFSSKAIGGGLCGSITASMAHALRFGIARGIFSNEAGMGSAAITAASASTSDPVRQGYINMTGTFWDTLVVCTITGLCIACSGVLGTTKLSEKGNYYYRQNQLIIDSSTVNSKDSIVTTYKIYKTKKGIVLCSQNQKINLNFSYKEDKKNNTVTKEKQYFLNGKITGLWKDSHGNCYLFSSNGIYEVHSMLSGSALTIAAFENSLGNSGGVFITIGIVLFAFSTILGWEYQGEKAFEYLLGTHKFNILYRIFFSLLTYLGATTTLEIAWTFSDIANALMAIPNLISLLVLRNIIKAELERYQRKFLSKKL